VPLSKEQVQSLAEAEKKSLSNSAKD